MITVWSDEAVQTLKELWAKGVVAKTIAHALTEKYGCKFTRASVIGKANRLKLMARGIGFRR